MTFGRYLRNLREGRHLRQTDLADRAGVSTVYICDIEKGRRYPPDLDKLRLWAAQLSLSPEEAALFYDLAGEARQSAPPDIVAYLNEHPAARRAVRRIIGQDKTHDMNALPSGK